MPVAAPRRTFLVQVLPVGDLGWTEFLPPIIGTKFFVSQSAGNDLNSGLVGFPVQSLAAAKALMTDGNDDQLFLKCGDDWTGESFPAWDLSGYTSGSPMLISTYGAGARPIVGGTTHGWATSQAVSNVAVVGIDFHPSTAPGGADWVGMRTLHDSSNILFEDCKIREYGGGILLQTSDPPGGTNRITNVRFRRCIVIDIADGFGGNDHSEGAYCRGVDGLLFEDSVFDRCGWNLALVPPMARNEFSHGLYISNECTDVKVVGCWLTNNASDGMQLRCGGVVKYNIAMGNARGLIIGQGGDNGYAKNDGVTCKVQTCLILDGQDIDGNTPRGHGIQIGNIASGTIDDVIMAGPNSGSFPYVMSIVGARYTGNPAVAANGVKNLVITNLIDSHWGGVIYVGGPTVENTSISDSVIPDIEYQTPPVAPLTTSDNMEVGTVDVSLGYYRNMLTYARNRERGVWSQLYEIIATINHAKSELGND